MNKRILMMPLGGFLAHVTRLLEIGKVLRDKGFEVIFAGPQRYVDKAKELGFEKHDLVDLNPDYVSACIRETTLYFHSVKSLNDLISFELPIYEKVKPALIVNDSRFSVRVSAKIAGLPLVSVTNASWTKFYKLRRPLPESHPYTRALYYLFSKDKARKILSGLIPPLTKLYSAVCIRPYNYHLRKHGLKRIEAVEDIWSGDRTLLADIPEYAPTDNIPESFHYVGPIIWESKESLPTWAERLEGSKPTLYLTLGSSGEASLFEKIMKMLASLPYQVIVTTGGIIKLESLNPVPGNFYLEEYLPGDKVMEISDAVIFHGGSGTAYQALAKGVPLIGIPTHFEQEWNIERLVEMKAGIKLNLKTLTLPQLGQAIEKILTVKEYKENALRIAKIIKGHQGAKSAASFIEEFAQQNH